MLKSLYSSLYYSCYSSVIVTLILGVVLCGAYPLCVYGIGSLFFPEKASGGVVEQNGKIIGARLIGQNFTKPEYFHGRPSFTGEKGYDATSSSGSNLGPTNPKLYDTVKANVDKFLEENPDIKKGEVPTEMVTASASGLDPHISPRSAFAQIKRIAHARKVAFEQVKALVEQYTEGPQLGLFGESAVNVLVLNIALDGKYPLESQQSLNLTKNRN